MQPTPALSKQIIRMSLNTKSARKGYYKGTGTGSMGDHTKYGGYVINWDKVRTYVAPTTDLSTFKLTPFITKKIKPVRGRFEQDPKGAFSGEAYLARWKAENGTD